MLFSSVGFFSCLSSMVKNLEEILVVVLFELIIMTLTKNSKIDNDKIGNGNIDDVTNNADSDA